MVDIALDIQKADSGLPTYKDLLLINNDLGLTSDAYPSGQAPASSPNPVLQDILQRMRFFLNEWFLDNTQGIPYYQQILVKNPDQSKIDAIFTNVILGTPGVTQLNSFSFVVNRGSRILNIAFNCATTSGVVNYSGIVPVTGG